MWNSKLKCYELIGNFCVVTTYHISQRASHRLSERHVNHWCKICNIIQCAFCTSKPINIIIQKDLHNAHFFEVGISDIIFLDCGGVIVKKIYIELHSWLPFIIYSNVRITILHNRKFILKYKIFNVIYTKQWLYQVMLFYVNNERKLTKDALQRMRRKMRITPPLPIVLLIFNQKIIWCVS